MTGALVTAALDGAAALAVVEPVRGPSAGNRGPIDTRLGLLDEPGAVRSLAMSDPPSLSVFPPCVRITIRPSGLTACCAAPLSRGMPVFCVAAAGLNDAEAAGSQVVAGGIEGWSRSSQVSWTSRLWRVICGQHCCRVMSASCEDEDLKLSGRGSDASRCRGGSTFG